MKITVIAHPNAKKARVELDSQQVLNVYIHPSAIEGKANSAVVEALAEYFHKKKSAIFLLQGHKSKIKVFEIL